MKFNPKRIPKEKIRIGMVVAYCSPYGPKLTTYIKKLENGRNFELWDAKPDNRDQVLGTASNNEYLFKVNSIAEGESLSRRDGY
jgi:hypothetical protein